MTLGPPPSAAGPSQNTPAEKAIPQTNTSGPSASPTAPAAPSGSAGAFASHFAVQPQATDTSSDPLTDPQELADIKRLSHGVAIVLLFSACRFLRRTTSYC